ncbi:MAG: tape measure protein [Sphingobacterium sp.]|nr:tape measure protein [Sphingobacterium sp.]
MAQRELAYVREVVDFLGLDIKSTSKQFLDLTAAAKGTVMEGRATKDIFEAVATAMARLGKTSDETSGAFLAIQQMISKGKVQAEELRGQLGERLPGAFSLAARAMGVTGAELNKLLELGKVTAEDLLPRLADELEKIYGTDTKITGVVAAWNRFNTALKELAVNADKASGSMGVLESALINWSDWAEAIKNVSNGLGLQAFGDQESELITLIERRSELLKEYQRLQESVQKGEGTFLNGRVGMRESLLEVAQELGAVLVQIDKVSGARARGVQDEWQKKAENYNQLLQQRARLEQQYASQSSSLQQMVKNGSGDIDTYQKLVLKTAQTWGEVDAKIAAVEVRSDGTVTKAAKIREANEQIARTNAIPEIEKNLRDVIEQYDPLAKAASGFTKAQTAINLAIDNGLIPQSEAVTLIQRVWEGTIGAAQATAARAEAQSAAAKADRRAQKDLQSMIDTYIPGAKEAREFAEAQKTLAAAVSDGAITQGKADQILSAMRAGAPSYTAALESQAEVLKLLGDSQSALRLERERDLKSVTSAERGMLKLKYALEDINTLQEQLSETANLTSRLDEIYGGMDASLISEFGQGMAEWYNPTDALGKIDTLKQSIRASMGATAEFGQTTTQAFEMQFNTLETQRCAPSSPKPSAGCRRSVRRWLG